MGRAEEDLFRKGVFEHNRSSCNCPIHLRSDSVLNWFEWRECAKSSMGLLDCQAVESAESGSNCQAWQVLSGSENTLFTDIIASLSSFSYRIRSKNGRDVKVSSTLFLVNIGR